MAKTASIDPKTLFEVGVHFGRSKSRRHPTAAPFVFGTKDTNDIFDLEETTKRLESALSEIERIAGLGKQVLFVGGKTKLQQP
jgi:ribosomal protein S2